MLEFINDLITFMGLLNYFRTFYLSRDSFFKRFKSQLRRLKHDVIFFQKHISENNPDLLTLCLAQTERRVGARRE